MRPPVLTWVVLGMALTWVWALQDPFPDEPWMLLQQCLVLVTIGTALAWTGRQARRHPHWWAAFSINGMALLLAFEPWFPHNAGDQGFTCGRLGFIPAAWGDAYLAWVESLWFWVPGIVLVATAAVIGVRKRDVPMLAWSMAATVLLVTTFIVGRPHDCD